MIDTRYLAFLGIVAATTVFFSMFNTPSIRGYRNLGFLTIYIGSLAWFFFAPFGSIIAGWCAFGVVSGMIYYLYELISVARSKEGTKEWPRLTTVLHGLAAWPIMLPEAIEYSLADMGILKATPILANDEVQAENDTSGA